VWPKNQSVPKIGRLRVKVSALKKRWPGPVEHAGRSSYPRKPAIMAASGRQNAQRAPAPRKYRRLSRPAALLLAHHHVGDDEAADRQEEFDADEPPPCAAARAHGRVAGNGAAVADQHDGRSTARAQAVELRDASRRLRYRLQIRLRHRWIDAARSPAFRLCGALTLDRLLKRGE